MFRNKKASNALGVVGIIAVILVIDAMFIYFAGVLGVSVNKDKFGIGGSGYDPNDTSTIYQCDCGVLDCTEYEVLHGHQALIDVCNQEYNTPQESSTSFDIITGFSEFPLFTTFFFIINGILAICVIIIVRGGSG